MQPPDPGKALPPHYNPSQFAQGAKPRSFCGCAAIGCGGFILVMVASCGLGYYVIVHTAWPAQAVASALEKTGDFKVTGLKGSLASGFEAEQVRFRPNQGPRDWSELNKLKFKYRMDSMWFGRSSDFVIEEISLDGGRVYGQFDSSLSDEEMNLFSFTDPLQELVEQLASSGDQGAGEFRVDLIRFANITIVDPQTETEFHVNEVRLEGLSLVDGAIADLGDWHIHVDGLDVTTERSQRPRASSSAICVSGTVRQGFGRRVKKDFTFALDLSPNPRGQLDYMASWFDGRVAIDHWERSGDFQMSIRDFSPGDYFSFERHGVIPEAIRLEFTVASRAPHAVQRIGEEGSFRVGQTTFSNCCLLTKDQERPGSWFAATAMVQDREVTAHARAITRLPLLLIDLEPVEGWTNEDLWARVAFGTDFATLNEQQQGLVQRSFSASGSSRKPPTEAEAEANSNSEQAEEDMDDDGQAENDIEPLEGMRP